MYEERVRLRPSFVYRPSSRRGRHEQIGGRPVSPAPAGRAERAPASHKPFGKSGAGASDFALRWHDKWRAAVAGEHGVGRSVADELLFIRIELEPGAQSKLGLFDIDAVVGQVLLGSAERPR